MIEYSGQPWWERATNTYQPSISVIEHAEPVETVAQKRARKAREAKAARVPFGFARALAEEGDR